jgi:hypothetical protein
MRKPCPKCHACCEEWWNYCAMCGHDMAVRWHERADATALLLNLTELKRQREEYARRMRAGQNGGGSDAA